MTHNEAIETIRTWIHTADDEYDIEEQGRVYGLMEALELIKQIEPEQEWIPVSEESLPDKRWVLGYINNIHDGAGAPHMCVVKIRKGISKKEREQLEKLKDPRAYLFYSCDEWGNNLVPYAWDIWGSGSYFGQGVVAWMPSPKRYEAEKGDKEWQK